MSEILVSVIVPVYNAQKHLAQCLDSILAQTHQAIEVICVDDGSTDESLAMLQEYAKKDSRVSVLHQENKFAGVARNLGMTKANGKYFVFWDSDDYFRPEAIETMLAKIEEDQADICVCGGDQYIDELELEFPVSRYADRTKIPEELPFNRTTNEAYILNFTGPEPWDMMFSAAFIREKGLQFQPIRNGNDVYFVENALCMAERITVVLDHLVVYRKVQKKSLMGTVYKSPLSPFQAWLDTAESLEKNGIMPKQSFVNRAMASFSNLLSNIRNWEAFCEAAAFMKNEGCPKLGLSDHPLEYFYNPWNHAFAQHMQKDSPEELLLFLLEHYNDELTMEMGYARSRNKTIHELSKELRVTKRTLENKLTALQNKYDDMENSASFKIGRVITAPVRKIRGERKR